MAVVRPRKRAPLRKPKREAASGGVWSRFLVMFALLAFLFWCVAFRSEHVSLRSITRKSGIITQLVASGEFQRLFAEKRRSLGGSEFGMADWKFPSGLPAEQQLAQSAGGVAAEEQNLELAGVMGEGDRLVKKIYDEELGEEKEQGEPVSKGAATIALTIGKGGNSRHKEIKVVLQKDTASAGGGGAAAGALQKWTPQNNTKYPTPVKKYLEFDISKETVTRIFLDAARYGVEETLPGSPKVKASKGGQCPQFLYGFEGNPGIASCWQPPAEDTKRQPAKYPENCRSLDESCVQETDFQAHEKWAAQVVVVHNVFINVAGQVFNRTHFFDHNGCAFDQAFAYRAKRTRVAEFSELVSLVDWFAWSAQTLLLDLFPLFVSLGNVLPRMRGVPVAFGHRLTHQRNELEQMMALGAADVVGLRLNELNAHVLQGSDLFFAERLILPLHQRCGRWSRSLFQHLRANHFLTPQGFPMFTPEYVSNAPIAGKPLDAPGKDWVVIVGDKDGKSRDGRSKLTNFYDLEGQLRKHFPSDRVVVYREGSLNFVRQKALFNRALFLLSIHGSALGDMVFMPPGGFVLEVRPLDISEAQYHHLAEACGHTYYLMIGEPLKKVETRRGNPVKRQDVHRLIAEISKAALAKI